MRLRNELRSLWLTTAFIAGLANSGVAQPDQSAKAAPQSSIFLQIVVFDSDSPGVSRVDQYIQVPYSELTFVSNEGSYLASYELTIQVRDSSGELAWQSGQSVDLRAKEFSNTVSDRLSSLRHISAKLKPGAYEYYLQVLDLESKRTAVIKRNFSVRSFDQDSVSVSDILIVNRVITDSLRTTIVPNVAGVFGRDAQRFYLYFEMYTRAPLDSVRLGYRIINRAGKECGGGFAWKHVDGPTTTVILGVDSIPSDAGDYRAIVEVASPTSAPRPAAMSVARSFSVSWRELPNTIQDIDKAIDQLRYIAEGGDVDFIREGKDVVERKQRLVAFWAKRDPDPRTERNELMEEYYARVAYCNEHFTHYTEGWRTDMGMVYIRFGPPENVERHPFETNSRPYEVWSYYQQNRQFVFVDETGFGDFRLQYPNTDLWGRLR
jgi:GWxTD domain-containing protein